jgi:hypothetical protein
MKEVPIMECESTEETLENVHEVMDKIKTVNKEMTGHLQERDGGVIN